MVYDGYHSRTYQDPETIIKQLSSMEHRLAASIQLTAGPRFEGVGLIKKSQLKMSGVVTKKRIFFLETKEKGGAPCFSKPTSPTI